MLTHFIEKEELSIGNWVKYKGWIGRVVAIPNEDEIMWCSNNGRKPEKVAINDLEFVPITLSFFQILINKEDIFQITNEENVYEFKKSLNYNKDLQCLIRIESNFAHVFVWELDMPGVNKQQKTFCTSVVYGKLHCLQNFITSLMRDLAEY
ncbi:MAG: hypothetical protein K2M66_02430 [Alistipes sp.]|nr:hypothetical protein [Alistipes sp.]